MLSLHVQDTWVWSWHAAGMHAGCSCATLHCRPPAPLQTCAYELMRTKERAELTEERGLWRVWNKQIVIGIVSPRQAASRG